MNSLKRIVATSQCPVKLYDACTARRRLIRNAKCVVRIYVWKVNVNLFIVVVVGVKFNKTFWDFIFIRRVKKETVKRIER